MVIFMKKTLSLILMLAITVGAMLSFSSCAGIDEILGAIGGGGFVGDSSLGGDSGQGGGDSNNGGDSSGDNGSDGSSGGVTSGGLAQGGTGNSIYLPDRDENASMADNLTSQSRTLLSTVCIVSTFSVEKNGYYGSGTEVAYGSGVIYSVDRAAGDAYIITNYHVIYNVNGTNGGICEDIKIYLYGQEYSDYAISATYVGGAMNYDIAVLKVHNSSVIKNSTAVAAKIGDSDDVNVLDEVIAVGNPEGYGMAVTEGIISVQSESLDMTGADGYTSVTFRVMRVSAAINSGNSGGGLYDSEGKLIGIVNAKRQGANIDNIGYAIPINLAKSIADNILYHCDGYLKTSVYKPVLGIKISSKAVGNVIEGEEVVIKSIVEIKEVVADSLAEGKLLAGDIINSVSVDGNLHTVTRDYHITDCLLDARVGSTVVLNVTRGALTLDVTITITEGSITTVK